MLTSGEAHARRAAPPSNNSAEGRGCSAFKPCPSGFRCVPFKQKCTAINNPKPYNPPPQPKPYVAPQPKPYNPPPPQPKPAPQMPPPGPRCAGEGGHCNVAGYIRVWYGANGKYAQRDAHGGIACNNQTFGDPIPGVVKACYYRMLPPPQQHHQQPQQQQPAPSGKTCGVLFEHANFQGRKLKLPAGRFDIGVLQAQIGNDVVSAVRVRPGCRVTLYEHGGFQGKKMVLVDSVPFLGHGFNDKTSAVELSWNGSSEHANACTIYEHANFAGRAQQLSEGAHGMGTLNGGVGNDQVSSVRCKPGYEAILFEHAGFKGAQHRVQGQQAFVGHGFNDKASSVVVRRTR